MQTKEQRAAIHAAIVYNLRYAFKDKVAHLSDEMLATVYDDFSLSDMHGNNDERFLEFLADV